MPPIPSIAAAALAALAAATTVAAADVVVTPVSVTSLTAPSDFFPAANLIDASGLPATPLTPDNVTTVTHAVASRTTAWVTADPAPGGGDWYAENNPDPVLTFSLPGTFDLTAAVLWGYHFGQLHNNEAKSFTAEFSSDGGATWHTPVQFDHGRSAAASETHPFGQAVRADTVRFTITDNHFGAPGVGGGDRVGIGEVRFLGAAVVDPAPVAFAPAAYDFGTFDADPGPLDATIPLANTGPDLPLNVLGTSLSGPGAPRFTVVGVPPQVPAGQAVGLGVTFDAAGQAGCFTAFLAVRTDAPANPTTVVRLTANVACDAPRPRPPEFSVPPSTFTAPLSVAITSTPGATVVYTTDGSLPSADNGTPYTTPVTVTSTTALRAAAIVPGHPPEVASATYVRLAPDAAAYSSPLPIVVLENFAAGAVPDKGWTTGTQTGAGLQQRHRQPVSLLVHEPDPDGGRATLTSPPTAHSRAGLRVRGAFSSTWDPQPFSLETWAEDGDSDDDVPLLGMPADSDWVLYYPHPDYDRSMLFNTFIWELGSQCGRYGTRFRFVDVFLNTGGGPLTAADRLGVYALAEKVKRSDDRIDFEPLSGDGTTGGWLLSVNRMDAIPPDGYPAENGATRPQFFHTPGPDRVSQTPANAPGRGDDIPRQYNAFINFENPNGYRINPGQRAAIEGWFREFENTFYDDDTWLDPELGYRRYVDTTDVATYFLLLNLARQSDGLLLSVFPWVSSGERKLHMGPMWDFNNGVYDRAGNPRSIRYFRADRLWYPRLFQDPQWERELRDRWFELRAGPLSNANMAALIDRQSAAITAELAAAQGLAPATWNARLDSMKSWLAQRADWLDEQYFAPPLFDLPGGSVPRATLLTLTDPTESGGTVYLTVDGSDPAGSATAVDASSAPFPVLATATMKARTRAPSGGWSALAAATYIVGPLPSVGNLAVSELHYNPEGGSEATEFVELLNLSATTTLELTGLSLAGAVRFTFPTGATLAPGARAVVVNDREAFTATYGDEVPVAGVYDGNLSNGGETLDVFTHDGRPLTSFTYDDNHPWPTTPDGDGPSLVAVNPSRTTDPDDPANWRPSTTVGGNPGTGDARPPFAGDPGADPDGDGIPALLEHALGSSTATADPHPLRLTATTVSFTRAINADDVRLTLQTSPDLTSWSPVEVTTTVPDPDAPLTRSQTTAALPPGTHFLRLHASQR